MVKLIAHIDEGGPMKIPQTRYTKTLDGVNIAYQVVGDGPDLALSHGWISNVEVAWEVPDWASALTRLASFSRLILFDKRGVGLSDRGVGMPGIEEKMDDVRAVLDAVGSERAHLMGESEGGTMTLQFAATYPERVASLILYGTTARTTRADDYPAGLPAQALEHFAEYVEAVWGTDEMPQAFQIWQPGESTAEDDELLLRFARRSASPREAADALRRNSLNDVRAALPLINVPTLVLHRADDKVVTLANGRYLAEHIPGARFVALPGDAHTFFVDAGQLLDEIEEWITGAAPSGAADTDRVLATVLFTDIVGSTERATELGDRRWRELLDRHDQAADRELERFRGRRVKSTGDGLLATFDGPARAVRGARAIVERMQAIGLEVRAGVHAGEVELRGDDIGGIAVHIGARISALAGANEVLVSSTVRDLVAGSGLTFDERGVHTLKGIPDEWRLFAATG
jgi:pimeloyl-ACP methyl ester carboxylesterase/class 3 adenylate cyclase